MGPPDRVQDHVHVPDDVLGGALLGVVDVRVGSQVAQEPLVGAGGDGDGAGSFQAASCRAR